MNVIFVALFTYIQYTKDLLKDSSPKNIHVIIELMAVHTLPRHTMYCTDVTDLKHIQVSFGGK